MERKVGLEKRTKKVTKRGVMKKRERQGLMEERKATDREEKHEDRKRREGKQFYYVRSKKRNGKRNTRSREKEVCEKIEEKDGERVDEMHR